MKTVEYLRKDYGLTEGMMKALKRGYESEKESDDMTFEEWLNMVEQEGLWVEYLEGFISHS